MKKYLILICFAAITSHASAGALTAAAEIFERIGMFLKSFTAEKAAVKTAVVVESEIAQKAATSASAHVSNLSTEAAMSKVTLISGQTADLATYKMLREQSQNGDVAAMLRMSDMTASKKVADESIPFPLWWTAQAAIRGSNSAIQQFKRECEANSLRALNKEFDDACLMNARAGSKS
jgi:hypothetical protein